MAGLLDFVDDDPPDFLGKPPWSPRGASGLSNGARIADLPLLSLLPGWPTEQNGEAADAPNPLSSWLPEQTRWAGPGQGIPFTRGAEPAGLGTPGLAGAAPTDAVRPRWPSLSIMPNAERPSATEPPEQRDLKPWALSQAPMIEGRDTGPFDSERSLPGSGLAEPVILAAGGSPKGPRGPSPLVPLLEFYRRFIQGDKPAKKSPSP